MEARKNAAKNIGNGIISAIVVPCVLAAVSVPPLIIAGAALMSAIAIYFWGHTRIAVWRSAMLPLALMLVGVCLYGVGAVIYFRSHETSNSSDLPDGPGFSAHAMLSLAYTPHSGRQYILRFKDKDGRALALYLSSAHTFTFALTDLQGETYSVQIPFSKSGIPFATPIDLSLGALLADDHTVLRVAVNGKTVAQQSFPVRVGPGTMPWSVVMAEGLTTDKSEKMLNGAPLDMGRLIVWKTFLGTQDDRQAAKSQMEYYDIKD